LPQAGQQPAGALRKRVPLRTNSLAVEIAEFIDDMAAAYTSCCLVVSRAGASAVNEIVCARRASILVPIPGTSGDHQLKNAQRLERAGAAKVIEQNGLTGEVLARQVTELLERPDVLARMECACDVLFPGDSAERIVHECKALLK
jgi:UDP-N-acetylglucosamine--N-acetylmuramyl-(pentapeptide) pyrophosphoryl-undecaprenol N-acetylglucosamine transferase